MAEKAAQEMAKLREEEVRQEAEAERRREAEVQQQEAEQQRLAVAEAQAAADVAAAKAAALKKENKKKKVHASEAGARSERGVSKATSAVVAPVAAQEAISAAKMQTALPVSSQKHNIVPIPEAAHLAARPLIAPTTAKTAPGASSYNPPMHQPAEIESGSQASRGIAAPFPSPSVDGSKSELAVSHSGRLYAGNPHCME